MNKKNKFLLFFVVLLAFILRFYKLTEVPPSLSWDEVSLGYNAYSILKTGKDEHGKFLPIAVFEAYGDYKPPGYIYATVPFVWIFGLNEFSVRTVSALSGTLTVLITFYLVKELFKKREEEKKQSLALLSAFLLAISPWHLNLSRAGFEANLALFFVATALYFFFRYINKAQKGIVFDSSILLAVIFSVLSLYTFNSVRIFLPLIGFSLIFIYRQKLWKAKKPVIIAGFVGIVIFLPLFFHLLSPQAKLRFREVNIFTDLMPIEISNARQEVHYKVWWSRILHNRRIIFATEVVRHYFDNLSPNFLFINGDGNPKFSIRDVGQLYLWCLPFLILGFYYLVREKQGEWVFIISWLFIGIIPASIARETPHALRIENSLPAWQIITAYGFLSFKEKLTITGVKKNLLYTVILGILFLNFLYYIHNYYYNYPWEFAREWQWGYREAIREIEKIEKNYDKVFFTNSIGRPYMYLLFYKQYSPQKFWQEVDQSGDPFGFFNVKSFGKYVFDIKEINHGQKILYVQKPADTPGGVNIIKKIEYPNGEIALVIYD